MNQPQPNGPIMDRLKWMAFGVVAGLVCGLILGWMFHAFVGLIVRLFLLLVLIAPFVVAFLFWQKIRSGGSARSQDPLVPDADWREIDRRR